MTGQYIIGPVNLLENLTDGNMGAVRYSLDGTKMLLENLPAKFEHLAENAPIVTKFTHEEILAYLAENKAGWEEELIL